jgi:hypothetical protein
MKDIRPRPALNVLRPSSLAARTPSPRETATREQATVRDKLSLTVTRGATEEPDRGPAVMSPAAHLQRGLQAPGVAPQRDDTEAFALARETGDAVAVMRSVGADDTDDSSSDSSSQAARPDPRAMEELAREVYTRLRRRLIVERERAGLDSRWA